MVKVRIGEFRDHVSEYLRRAEHGETIVILNRDREVAVLQRPAPRRVPRRLLGCMKGTACVSDEIVQPIPEGEWFRS
jgi:prevent-host-death family protein